MFAFFINTHVVNVFLEDLKPLSFVEPNTNLRPKSTPFGTTKLIFLAIHNMI